jgi:2-oxoglutarate ferredoxin oxidoreductase subunit beta
MPANIENMVKVFERPRSLTGAQFSYCPGCHHGVVTRIIAHTIDELGIQDRAVIVAPVGCAVTMYEWFRCDGIQAAHGRACAVATGIKRVNPNLIVFTYQGDGDLAAIGTAESIHAANRGENITVVFINNQIYGMTGGQMAPTTLIGQWATSCPDGRNAQLAGYPIRFAEMIAQLDAPVYVTRQALYDQKRIVAAARAIKKAFQCQVDCKGYSLVEVLTNCPTNWRLSPVETNSRLMNEVVRTFPLGDFVDRI